MKTQQYENIYLKSETKEEGSLLQAVEWNTLADAVTSAQTKINSLVEDVASASTPSSSSEPAATTGNITIGGQDNNSHMYLNSKGNLCIETTVNNVPNNKKGKINIESKDDIQLKPGDDIVLQSDHRETSKQDAILIKAVNGEDDPVELKINASNVTFSAKDKADTYTFLKYSTLEEAQTAANDSSTPPGYTISDLSVNLDTLFDNKRTYTLNEVKGILGTNFLSLSLGETKVIKINRDQTNAYYVVKRKNDPTNVINLNIEDNEGNEGYLKVRAQAIDLRCEGHGGVALQPKGYDSDSHMNKIKFEHGGGDGLEFGTFNTEKTSIFTDEYRFNKNGVWKMATRTTEASDKADSNDNTTALKYVKQADDFYDVISDFDKQVTTKEIIDTVYKFNHPNVGFKFVGKNLDNTSTPSITSSNSASYSATENEGTINDLTNTDYFEYAISAYTTVLSIIDAFALNSAKFEDFVSSTAISGYSYITILTSVTSYTFELKLEDFEINSVKDANIRVNEGVYIGSENLTGGHIEIQNLDFKDFDTLDTVSLSDIITVVNYFKTNNSEGPFAV